MRCDDVQDWATWGDGAPTLQSLLILNEIDVNVTTTPNSPSWHTLRKYQMSYEQGLWLGSYHGNTIYDPLNGLQESVAGYTDLVKIQEFGDDGTTSLPPLSMSYTTIDEWYEDASNPNTALQHPVNLPGNPPNCGPSWNKGQSGACMMWNEMGWVEIEGMLWRPE
jgi:hypothetical protein